MTNLLTLLLQSRVIACNLTLYKDTMLTLGSYKSVICGKSTRALDLHNIQITCLTERNARNVTVRQKCEARTQVPASIVANNHHHSDLVSRHVGSAHILSFIIQQSSLHSLIQSICPFFGLPLLLSTHILTLFLLHEFQPS